MDTGICAFWARLFFIFFPLFVFIDCSTAQTRNSNSSDNFPRREQVQPQVGGIEEVYKHPITQKDKARFQDCSEYSPATRPWRSATPYFDLFNDALNDERKFYITEESGYPFVIGYHDLKRITPNTTWIVALRGESSGFHSTPVAKGVRALLEDLPGAAMITIDEYKYKYSKNPLPEPKPLHPICHRTNYPEGRIFTETPGLLNGGGVRLLKKILPKANPVIFISYSNSTTPRGEFLTRRLLTQEKLDYRQTKDPKAFLDKYILQTGFDDRVYAGIKGFIDIEGNYEYNKALWDLLAYIKLEVEHDPNKFYYSAMRIEKVDAYPVQTTMIRALGLKGVEDENGIIRFTNASGNVIIDMVTNHYEPYYLGNGGDIRKNTPVVVYPGKVKRTVSNHFMLAPFVHKRLLETTHFLRKEKELPTASDKIS
ncbi:MAG: hypothetical protein LDLANPLL_01401 [Turneriella sp.]|nr:hypothetical protein [Turneriella sp.]